MSISRYRVSAMDCHAEEQLVRMALADLEGITAIEIDMDGRTVAIAHDTDRRSLDAALAGILLGAEHLEDMQGELEQDPTARDERPALLLALAINAVFFVGEVGFGLFSGSMGLVADGLDMGADAAVYALGLAAVGTAMTRKQRLARASGWVQAGLAVIGLAETVRRAVVGGEVPDTTVMAVVAAAALVANVVVLVALRRVRTGEVHIEASWIFTANDVLVNLLVLGAAGLATVTDSALPDLVAGAIIFLVVANGARRILSMARTPS